MGRKNYYRYDLNSREVLKKQKITNKKTGKTYYKNSDSFMTRPFVTIRNRNGKIEVFQTDRQKANFSSYIQEIGKDNSLSDEEKKLKKQFMNKTLAQILDESTKNKRKRHKGEQSYIGMSWMMDNEGGYSKVNAQSMESRWIGVSEDSELNNEQIRILKMLANLGYDADTYADLLDVDITDILNGDNWGSLGKADDNNSKLVLFKANGRYFKITMGYDNEGYEEISEDDYDELVDTYGWTNRTRNRWGI